MDEWEAMVTVGRIARPHGNRGGVIVNPDTDFPDRRFRAGNTLYRQVEGRPVALTIEDVRFHRDRPIVRFAGVTTISEAEALASLDLRVPETDLEPLPPGRYYHHELVGCRVETTGGRLVGTVSGIESGDGGDRLIVSVEADEVQIPLVDAICVRVDPASRRITVDPPDGLLDLNRSRRRSPRDDSGEPA